MMIPFVIVITLYQVYKKTKWRHNIMSWVKKKNTKNQIEKFGARPFFFEGIEASSKLSADL